MRLIDLVDEREISIAQALEGEKTVLRRLIELSLCEDSAYTNRPINQCGEFGYRYLDQYWIEDGRFPFIVSVDDELAGFALVNRFSYADDIDFSMAEFYILPRYRKCGIGRHVATQIFHTYRGRWEVRTHASNSNGVAFWIKVIARFTEGSFEEYPGGLGSYEGPIWVFDSTEVKAPV